MARAGRTALVVRGGWAGHAPVAASDRYAERLERDGYRVTVSDTLDSYLDAELLAGTDLVVQCWTMGAITEAQAAGLTAAVRAGTGLAGWHGGIVDAFRESTEYQLMTGGQFVHHPREHVRYLVTPVGQHPATAGVAPFELTSEQYYLHLDPAVVPLAVTEFAADPDHPELTGVTVPVAWARSWGAGRVFVTVLGHTPADLAHPQADLMLRQGMYWATRGAA
ncbi:ThuA domain-containing protein [Kitasatospora sp. NPDC051853]|uniref:ThuA domain-containing protein n=1 Tax=Kitasatospora sp. NPDC051853 TaxID=3364058 RepID=UPI0037A7F0E3